VRVEAAQHAILARVADSYRLKDLNSTNGTQVNVPPDARPSSKLQAPSAAREGDKPPPSSFYGNGGTKFSKRLNREHARQPCLEQKQATNALSSRANHCSSKMPNDSAQFSRRDGAWPTSPILCVSIFFCFMMPGVFVFIIDKNIDDHHAAAISRTQDFPVLLAR
jgi:hypothetical protein